MVIANHKRASDDVRICWSPNWNGPQTNSETPRFGILTNPYPNRFRESQHWFGDCFFWFFSVTHKMAFSRQKMRQSQRHGDPQSEMGMCVKYDPNQFGDPQTKTGISESLYQNGDPQSEMGMRVK